MIAWDVCMGVGEEGGSIGHEHRMVGIVTKARVGFWYDFVFWGYLRTQ